MEAADYGGSRQAALELGRLFIAFGAESGEVNDTGLSFYCCSMSGM